MMQGADFLQNLIGIHANWLIMIAAGSQILFAYFVVRFTVDNPRLTPVPPLGSASEVGHLICRLIAALAWIGIIAGAAMSLVGVIYINAAGRVVLGAALNDTGVLVSRLSGPVIFFHVLGMCWRFLLLEEREREREAADVFE